MARKSQPQKPQSKKQDGTRRAASAAPATGVGAVVVFRRRSAESAPGFGPQAA
ncbi:MULTISPECIES: hypothetical protein [unclassified Kitasatospora]|uniref:hypothetical protein n=1 Tax=unclassified Kitasatospora TaxID=2633591 RepID=UPI000A56408B|nr:MULTISPECIES: hypothetical protein [unclassified Kitasatospora]